MNSAQFAAIEDAINFIDRDTSRQAAPYHFARMDLKICSDIYCEMEIMFQSGRIWQNREKVERLESQNGNDYGNAGFRKHWAVCQGG